MEEPRIGSRICNYRITHHRGRISGPSDGSECSVRRRRNRRLPVIDKVFLREGKILKEKGERNEFIAIVSSRRLLS